MTMARRWSTAGFKLFVLVLPFAELRAELDPGPRVWRWSVWSGVLEGERRQVFADTAPDLGTAKKHAVQFYTDHAPKARKDAA
jgi:hypothetical protein